MQQGRTAGQSFRPQRFTDFFNSPYPLQVKVARIIARAEKGLSIPEIQERAGCSADSVRSMLKTMRKLKSVYISEWRKGRNVTAVYSLGSLPDAERPVVENAPALASKKPAAVKEAAKEVIAVNHYAAVANALAPQRNEKKRQEVNRMYLNWISGGAYG